MEIIFVSTIASLNCNLTEMSCLLKISLNVGLGKVRNVTAVKTLFGTVLKDKMVHIC